MQFRLYGGEGGIRTLGTGVSPYNGLANESFSPPSLVVKHFQSDPTPPSRTQSLSFGSYCAPLCAPEYSEVSVFEIDGCVTLRREFERTSDKLIHPIH
jgi:hypothetical protein